MKFLFLHQNFPAQFLHLAAALAQDGSNEVVALSRSTHPCPAGVKRVTYQLLRSAAEETHPLLREEEQKVLLGEACAAAAMRLKREGFTPDCIVAHPGWGEALFIKEVFPESTLVAYAEYHYAAEGQDVGFDPEDPPVSFHQRCQLRMRNLATLSLLAQADAAITPTEWQRSTFPPSLRQKIHVIHEGVQTSALAPNANASLQLPAHAGRPARVFHAGEEILTFVARNLEPIRGFHVFMRALPAVLRARPEAQVLVVGADAVGYGAASPDGRSWKQRLLDEASPDLDLARVHFLGTVPYQAYLQVMRVSRLHFYWTAPFVLSWSFMEAAALGCRILASATAPVLEFAEELGIETFAPFDIGALEARLIAMLGAPGKTRPATLPSRLGVKACVQQQLQLIQAL